MRVLLDGRLRRGGVGAYVETLAPGLAALDDPPVTLTLGTGSGRAARAVGAPFTPWGRRLVAAAAERWAADLVHGLHVEVPATGVPAVVTIPDLIPLEHPPSMPGRTRRVLFGRVVAASLRRTRRVIVPSEQTAAALAARGADRRRLRVVPCGVRPSFRPARPEEQEEARRRFAGGRPYVAAALTARPHKNAGALAAAAALVASRHRVAFVSTGRPVPAGLPHVGFLGGLPTADVRALYGGAEAVVVPSLVEGFGLPALEALACGVPVVAGPRLGALPYLRPGLLVVDVRRPAEIAAAVARLLTDAGLRSELGDAGLVAAGRLTQEAVAERTAAVYAEALGPSSGRLGG